MKSTEETKKLDVMVRAICTMNRHYSEINIYHNIGIADRVILELFRTHGAGTNSSHVYLKDSRTGVTITTELYEASDYGKHVIVYRPGNWIDHIESAYTEAQKKAEKERDLREAKEKEDKKRRFAPFDIAY